MQNFFPKRQISLGFFGGNPNLGLRFLGDIPVLESIFNRFVKPGLPSTSKTNLPQMLRESVQAVFCLGDFHSLEAEQRANSNIPLIKSSFLGSGDLLAFSKSMQEEEDPPKSLYTLGIDGTITINLEYLQNNISFFYGSKNAERVLIALFNQILPLRPFKPDGLYTFLNQKYKTKEEKSFFLLCVHVTNLSFVRSICLEQYLDFSNASTFLKPFFANEKAISETCFMAVQKAWGNKVTALPDYGSYQAVFQLFASNITTQGLLELFSDTNDLPENKIKEINNFIENDKTIASLSGLITNFEAKRFVYRVLAIILFCEKVYREHKAILNTPVSESKDALSKFFLSIPYLKNVSSGEGQLKNMFYTWAVFIMEKWNRKAWIGGIEPTSAKNRVGIGQAIDSESSCSLEKMIVGGESELENCFVIPPDSTFLSLFAMIFDQAKILPKIPYVQIESFKDYIGKDALASIDDNDLYLYYMLVFYAIQCFVQMNCKIVLSATEIEEKPVTLEQRAGYKTNNEQRYLELLLGASVAVAGVSAILLLKRMYQSNSDRRNN